MPLPPDLEALGAKSIDNNDGVPDDLKNLGAESVQSESLLSKGWKAISSPLTDAPSRFAKSVADSIDAPSLDRSPMMARIRGFGAGATQGIGDLISGLTSPINLATTAATLGEGAAIKSGLPTIGKGLNLISKAASAPVAIHGASQIIDPNTSLQEKGFGLTELAGGAAGMFHSPTATKSGAKVPVEETSNTNPFYDKFAEYRKVPVGTKYTISPEKMTRQKMTDAIKLGFNYEGLDDKGRIIIRKTKPSPEMNVPEAPNVESSALAEVANLPRTIMASEDLSAPLRQGLGLIHKKAFWTSLPDMVKALGSEDAYKQIQSSITDDPIFKKRITADGKVGPSFAEEAGLKLTDLSNMTSREESMMSSLAEKVPGVRASNRAYTAFLNKLRADTFKQMTTDFGAFSGLDVKNNIPLAKDIAEFVNNASGRGSLGKLEPSAKALSSVLFSPRLIASRLQMMGRGAQALFSPEVYTMSQPSVRREYLKSLFAIGAVGNAFTQLLRMSGGTVETDPASSDFGKAKMGNTRIDPYGGFQQIIVAAQRLMPDLDLSSMGLGEIGGKMKSSTTGVEYDLGHPKFGQSTRADVLTRFIRGKTNPIINFAWGLMAGQRELSGKPMDMTTMNPMENSIAQRFMPMLSQDIYDLINDEETPPQMKALAAFLSSVGMGSQTYGNK